MEDSKNGDQQSDTEEPEGFREDWLEAMLDNPRLREKVIQKLKARQNDDQSQHFTPSGMSVGGLASLPTGAFLADPLPVLSNVRGRLPAPCVVEWA